MKNIFIVLSILIGFAASAQAAGSGALFSGNGVHHDPTNPPPLTGAYYHWAMGQDRTGYCYQFTSQGAVLNGGWPVAESFCEATCPSKPKWAQATNGWGYCYQFTPNGLVLYQGRAQANEKCEKVSPSHYEWARAIDGWTYCYQMTQNKLFLNDGRPVPNEKCY